MENKKLKNVVVIKDERTEFLWKEEFESIYTQLNNNQDIGKLSFLDMKKENEKFVLKSEDTNVQLEEIKDSTVLFLTDGAFILKSFHVQDMLTQLSNDNMVSILNLMPKNNWRNLATGEPDVDTVISANSKSNKDLETTFQWYHEEDGINPKDIYLTVPMIYANKENIDNLLNNMIEGGSVKGILIPTTEELINYIKNPIDLKVNYGNENKTQTPEDIAADKVYKFRFITSPEAYDLATFLSVVDSFTIEDIKLVQKEFFPEGTNSHIAELYLGGILQSLEKDQQKNEHTRLTFQQGVAKELFRALRYSEENKMLRILPELSIMKSLSSNKEKNKNIP